jgi:hypothetical protein
MLLMILAYMRCFVFFVLMFELPVYLTTKLLNQRLNKQRISLIVYVTFGTEQRELGDWFDR